MRSIAPGIHVHETPLRFLGMQLGARMTVLSLEDGLLLHSPTAADPAEVEALGTPCWVLAPNKFHHLYAGPWLERGLEGWCAQGIPAKRPELGFDHTVTEPCEPFGDEVLLIPLTCFSFTNEVVLLHRPSRTLIVTDLVFNLAPDTEMLTKTLMCCAGAYPGCRTSTLERIAMNRPRAREDLRQLLDLDFDRLIMGHGDILDTGGKAALRNAFAWLGLD